MQESKTNIIKANQLIKANIISVSSDGIVGIGNTVAIIYKKNKKIGYDLINQQYLPIYNKMTKDGIYLYILKIPFKNNKKELDVNSLEPYIEEYRGNSPIKKSLYTSNFVINAKELDDIITKRKINK